MHKVVFTLLVFTVLTVFGQQQGEACEGVKIIYPKSSSVIKRNEEIYIILGNSLKNKNYYLKQVNFISKNGTQEESNTVWTGHDELLKVSVVQHNLNTTTTGTFTLNAVIEENDRECQVESGSFEVI
ncbi:hypothetical protein G6F46_008881 [Rhizopus delemar]|uniref:Immunoglobulin subtype domain-containing protein n=2 Tax=Rhizopus TaxID=4842 RepID=A0A9P6YZE6_9FUNG|nr:hypothetical protein G6F55_011523 [Rhizopus delemar]KAG1538135.1 hypothetical protein G6F51_009955 [Rhizopus arrhizus]KAG1489199.1 hypothetical protein G6F54_011607 [Rhizopus delemar]KAG1507753.1 hypothetical protein G6F53_008713 [Rhizopus delemar]KAG1512489.1 hypothetical protein G6F52_010394 [Rhizopus delemar]